jgi:hypothetical protein
MDRDHVLEVVVVSDVEDEAGEDMDQASGEVGVQEDTVGDGVSNIVFLPRWQFPPGVE